jgi:DNA polymerase sigma
MHRNETFEGGMGSYLLVLLLIHVIQKRRKKDEEERIRALALNQIRAKEDLIREKLLTEQGIDATQAKEQAQLDNGRAQFIAEPTTDDDELLGRLFADFFFEIGVNLDYSQGISVRESGSLFDKSTR